MDQIAKWQAAIDRDFPHGAIATWQRGSPELDTSYNIAYIQVTGLAGLDPTLKLYVFGADRVLEDMVVRSWDTVRESPLIIQATFENEDAPMRFVADVPPQLATLMDAERPVLAAANPLPAPA